MKILMRPKGVKGLAQKGQDLKLTKELHSDLNYPIAGLGLLRCIKLMRVRTTMFTAYS